jgi:hypothetical protein
MTIGPDPMIITFLKSSRLGMLAIYHYQALKPAVFYVNLFESRPRISLDTIQCKR